jgi:hypothetical protein
VLIFKCIIFMHVTPCSLSEVTYLGVPSIATMFSIVFIFLFSFYTPLHVSTLKGHLQVKYTHNQIWELQGAASYYAYNGFDFRLYNLYIY